jgi:hypothetical protein
MDDKENKHCGAVKQQPRFVCGFLACEFPMSGAPWCKTKGGDAAEKNRTTNDKSATQSLL